jgi:hypothetical protein
MMTKINTVTAPLRPQSAEQENQPVETFKATYAGDLEFANSSEGREWARAFVRFCKANPSIAWDEDTMTGWFANAIMRGYDEAYARAAAPAAPLPQESK